MNKIDKRSKAFEMTAICGIYCASCECHTAKDNPELMQYLIESRNIPADKLPCAGCRKGEGVCPAIGEDCETYQCARDRNVDFCFECTDYPCSRLHPAADLADKLPHNLKMYNLAFIQQQGLERFAEEAAASKEKYFKGRMMIGKGPQIV